MNADSEPEIFGDFFGLGSFAAQSAGSYYHMPTIALLARDKHFKDMEAVKCDASHQLFSSLNSGESFVAILFIEHCGTVHVFKRHELTGLLNRGLNCS